MQIDTITEEMDEYETCDALRLAPFSHPDYWQKRVDELRKQGRDDEAALVETKFAHKLDDEARRQSDRLGRTITRVFGS